MTPTSRALPFLFATAALAAALAAQCPPGAPMPLDLGIDSTLPDVGAAATRRSLAKDALAARDFRTARQHLHAALEFHPSAVPLLADLALACADDADLAAIAVDRLVRAAHDAQGKLQLDAPVRKALAALPGGDAQLKAALERHTLRLAAMAELARFVDKHKAAAKGNAARAVLVHWAAGKWVDVDAAADSDDGASDELFPGLAAAAVEGRAAFGERVGQRDGRVGRDGRWESVVKGPPCAAVGGFSLHAGAWVAARDREKMEKLCRYAARPAVAASRLVELVDGRIGYGPGPRLHRRLLREPDRRTAAIR